MNKKQIVASLNNIANQLDNNGLFKEASFLTNVMIKVADEFNIPEKTFSDDADKDRIPLDKMPALYMNYDRGDELTLRNFDPLMPVEGQEMSRDELWEKFIEYLRKFKINAYTGYAYNMWNVLLKEHNMGKSNFKGYRNRLEHTEKN